MPEKALTATLLSGVFNSARMSGFGSSGALAKELGPVTVGQILAMVIALAIGLLLFTYGGANNILVILIVAVVVYMLPHLFGADVKVKATFGVVFAVCGIIVGGLLVGPAFIDEHDGDSVSERNGISFEMTGDTVTAQYTGTEDLQVIVCEVLGVMFKSVTLDNPEYLPMAKSGSTYTCTLSLPSDKMYNICVAPVDGDGKAVLSSQSYSLLTGSGGDADLAVYSTAIVMLYCMVFYYLILVLTTLMRRKITDTREKMEAQGRLYPQGYGRCTFCGAVVLPGEVNCRKCGAYIDRPEYMKPHKKNYLTCSACGAEISQDMTECPKCGAKFDGEESVVTHADGTSDTTTEMMECPVCGKHIPAISEMCVYCGKKFE